MKRRAAGCPRRPPSSFRSPWIHFIDRHLFEKCGVHPCSHSRRSALVRPREPSVRARACCWLLLRRGRSSIRRTSTLTGAFGHSRRLSRSCECSRALAWLLPGSPSTRTASSPRARRRPTLRCPGDGLPLPGPTRTAPPAGCVSPCTGRPCRGASARCLRASLRSTTIPASVTAAPRPSRSSPGRRLAGAWPGRSWPVPLSLRTVAASLAVPRPPAARRRARAVRPRGRGARLQIAKQRLPHSWFILARDSAVGVAPTFDGSSSSCAASPPVRRASSSRPTHLSQCTCAGPAASACAPVSISFRAKRRVRASAPAHRWRVRLSSENAGRPSHGSPSPIIARQ